MTGEATSAFQSRALDSLVLVALALAVWQGLYEYAGDAAITSPLTTFGFAASLVKTSNFWDHAQATLVAFLYSLAISIVLGVVLGLILPDRCEHRNVSSRLRDRVPGPSRQYRASRR